MSVSVTPKGIIQWQHRGKRDNVDMDGQGTDMSGRQKGRLRLLSAWLEWWRVGGACGVSGHIPALWIVV